MTTPNAPASSPRGVARRVWLPVLVLGVVPVALLGGVVALIGGPLDTGPTDAAIPNDRARRALAAFLKGHGLDPAVVVDLIAARERHDGGLRGGTTRWFLARLDPAHAAAFPADLQAALRTQPDRPGGDRVDSLPDRLAQDRALGLPRLPPEGRAWRLDAGRAGVAVVAGDRFVLYQDDR